jgi:hypothetical protein
MVQRPGNTFNSPAIQPASSTSTWVNDWYNVSRTSYPYPRLLRQASSSIKASQTGRLRMGGASQVPLTSASSWLVKPQAVGSFLALVAAAVVMSASIVTECDVVACSLVFGMSTASETWTPMLQPKRCNLAITPLIFRTEHQAGQTPVFMHSPPCPCLFCGPAHFCSCLLLY